MFRVVASFDERLGIYIQMRRPIDEPDGKKIRLFG